MGRPASWTLAFAIGFASLWIQSAWIRVFTQAFGLPGQAVAIVVAIALLGLAVGAIVVGQLADRSPNPLRLLHLLLAGCGLAILGGMPLVKLLVAMPVASPGLRFLSCFLAATCIVLPPNFLIGGILPTLLRIRAVGSATARGDAGIVYGAETLGAAVGAISFGFWGIHKLGNSGALLMSGGICLLAAAALAITPRVAGRSSNSCTAGLPMGRTRGGRRLLCAVGLASFTTLGLELIWTRWLAVVAGTDTRSYSVVAASVLAGVGFGSAVGKPVVSRLRNSLSAYGWLQIAVAASAVAAFLALNLILNGGAQTWLLTADNLALLRRLGVSLALLFPMMFLVGMSFPVAVAAVGSDQREIGRQAGQVYATSALGNVAGALVTGFVLVPRWGLQMSLVILVGISIASAAVVLRPVSGGRQRLGLAAAICVGAIGCMAWPWLWPPRPLGIPELSQFQLLYYREGALDTVAVLQHRDNPTRRLMAVDGTVVGDSEGGVAEKQQVLAHLPFLLRPEKQKSQVLTIGLGSGIVAGELIQNPSVSHVTCVELSPTVIEAAREFHDLNHQVLNRPDIWVIEGDGFHFVRTSPLSFDAIISDGKSRAGSSGNTTFFTAEYYKSCAARLAADGVFVQWVPLEESPEALRVILATINESFPYCYLGIAPPTSLYLVGTLRPIALRPHGIQTYLEAPRSVGLRRYGWRHACDILQMLVADSESIRSWLGPEVALNELDCPVIEAHAHQLFSTQASTRVSENLVGLRRLVNVVPSAIQVESTSEAEWDRCRQSAIAAIDATVQVVTRGENWLNRATSHFEEAIEIDSRLFRIRQLASALLLDQAAVAESYGDTAEALRKYRRALHFQSRAESHLFLARHARKLGDLTKAAGHYGKASKLRPDNPALRLELAFALSATGRLNEARDHFERVLSIRPNEPRAHFGLGIVLLSLEEQVAGARHLLKAAELAPDLREQVRQLGIEPVE